MLPLMGALGFALAVALEMVPLAGRPPVVVPLDAAPAAAVVCATSVLLSEVSGLEAGEDVISASDVAVEAGIGPVADPRVV